MTYTTRVLPLCVAPVSRDVARINTAPSVTNLTLSPLLVPALLPHPRTPLTIVLHIPCVLIFLIPYSLWWHLSRRYSLGCFKPRLPVYLFPFNMVLVSAVAQG